MALTQAYLSLEDADKQRKELQHLVQSLSFSHIREMRDMFRRLHLTCDIVGELPTELSEQVMLHLPLYQCYQARRVSKRWNKVLSSDHLIKQIVDSQSLALQHVQSSYHNDTDLTSISQNLDAYLRCYPFSMMNQHILYEETWRYATHVAYAQSNLVWIDADDQRSLKILNLASGFRDTLTTPNRAKLDEVAVSSTIAVALCSSAKCHIWILSASPETRYRNLQLDSSINRGIAVSSSGVSLYQPFLRQGISAVRFIIWEVANERTREFTHTLKHLISKPVRCGFAEDGRSLMMLAHMVPHHKGECEIHYLRSDLVGNIEAQTSEQCPWLHVPNKYISRLPGQAINGPILDSFISPNLNGNSVAIRNLFKVTYDSTQEQLKIKCTNPHDAALWAQHPQAAFGQGIAAYGSWDDFGSRCFPLKELATGVGAIPKHIRMSLDKIQLPSLPCPPDEEFSLVLGDGRFLIANTRAGITVWCFDKRITMPNEDTEYRRRRESELKELINQQRVKEELLKESD